MPCKLDMAVTAVEQVICGSTFLWHTITDDLSPLSDRGWVLQEEFFSLLALLIFGSL